MKYRSVFAVALVAAVSAMVSSPAEAGWRHLRGGSSGVYATSYGSSGYSSYGSSGYSSSYGSSGYSSYGSSGYTASYGSSGYSTSYGSSGYSSYGSSGYSVSYGSSGAYYGSSGRPGIVGRVANHLAVKRALRASYRASYGSSGYGSSGYTHYGYYSGGSSGSYYGGSSGTSVRYAPTSYGSSGTTSYGSSGTSHYGSTSLGSHYYSDNSAKASTGVIASLAKHVADDSVHLTVSVPNDAKIFVNDKETTSTGSIRQFVSRGLKSDKTYKYEIRAEIVAADGETLVETKELFVSAGAKRNLDFAFSDHDNPVGTSLTLNVPEGAEVTLAGNSTKAVGLQRTYRTNQLKLGDVWEDYEVEVRVGEQTKRQTVRLIAGDQLELTFNFDQTDRLAAR